MPLFLYLREVMLRTCYISVILPLKLEWEPCYFVDGADCGQIGIGDRARVRFANHEYVGVISGTDIQPEIDPKKIQKIIGIEHGLERILPEEIALWQEVAGYYMCTVGEVYKAAYPAMKINLEEARAAAMQKVQERREKLLDGMRAKVRRIEERLSGKEEMLGRSKEGTKARAKNEQDRRKILYELETARKALQNAESASRTSCDADRDMIPSWQETPDPQLSRAQSDAYSKITAEAAKGKPVLLHGVTGSGKTEIYIKYAKDVLRGGQNVLYLVPEIALSRQLEDRLRRHFRDTLLVFHSGESAVSRRNTAESIRKAGPGYIVLGTRSSLFLPHHDLGLIIVDEEHDTSYKQDSPAPRYNGRDTALMLSVIQGRSQGKPCRILLGSATPSLEELYNCQVGRHSIVRLTERYHGSQEAEVEIIDTKAERRKNGMVGNFSRRLIAHIGRTLSEGRQVMILRSRRAWAPAVQCDTCGEIAKCPHCNVSLSLHGKTGEAGVLTCHYCGYRRAYTARCDKCNGTARPIGAGTQKIEEEAQRLFPDARIARLDSDTSQNKSFETRTIKDFAKGDIDILVGTQMLTKGFDFSRLSLVAVIAADSMLGLQDFRADEKAAQLLEQFRGRCGRRESKGLFVIQTSQPDHPIYANLTEGNSDAYSAALMQERRDFLFPPYARIIELTVRDIYEDRAERMAGRLADMLRRQSLMQVTGPYSPVVDKVADTHIRVIRVSLRKDRNLRSAKAALRDMIRDFEKENRYNDHIVINADPA